MSPERHSDPDVPARSGDSLAQALTSQCKLLYASSNYRSRQLHHGHGLLTPEYTHTHTHTHTLSALILSICGNPLRVRLSPGLSKPGEIKDAVFSFKEPVENLFD